MDSSSRRQSHMRHYLVVATCALSVFVTLGIMLNSFGIFIPVFASALDTDITSISLYITILALVMGFFMSFAEKAISKFGMKPIATISILGVAVAYLALSFATSIPMLYVIAVWAGIMLATPAMLMGPTMINRWFAKKSGLFLGIVYAFASIGSVVFNLVGSTLNASLGLGFTFRVYCILALVLALPLVLTLKETPAAAGLLPYGATPDTENENQQTAAKSAEQDVSGVSYQQARRSPAFAMMIIVAILLSIIGGVYHMLPSYAQGLEVTQEMPLFGAILASCSSASSALGSVFVGALNDKSKKLTVIVLAVLGLLSVLGYMLCTWSAVILIVCAFLGGLYFFCSGVETPVLVQATFGSRDYSVIVSRVLSVSTVCGAFGVTIWSLLLSKCGYVALFGTAAIVTIAFGLLALTMLKLGERMQEKSDEAA